MAKSNAPRWSRADLVQHYRRAVDNGWIAAFISASQAVGVAVAILMAIASRETNMRSIKGDFRKSKYFPRGGHHGYGVMQLDIGSHGTWIRSGAWEDPAKNIRKGAEAFAEKRAQIQRYRGKRVPVRGGFTGAQFTELELTHISAASYNSGLNAYYAFSTYGRPDALTTGHDYGADVLARAVVFAELLAADGLVTTAATRDAARASTTASVTVSGTSGVTRIAQLEAARAIGAFVRPGTFAAGVGVFGSVTTGSLIAIGVALVVVLALAAFGAWKAWRAWQSVTSGNGVRP